MATRARIALELDNGSFISSYQHWDGYPGGLGYNLIDHWCDPAKVKEAIELGDASKWGYIVGSKVDFDDRNDPMHDIQNVYYGRDRGEKDQGHRVYKDEADYLANGFNSGEEYIYLMKDTGEKNYIGKSQGTWFFAHYSNPEFKPLMRVAVQEHIDILRRSCLKEEVA